MQDGLRWKNCTGKNFHYQIFKSLTSSSHYQIYLFFLNLKLTYCFIQKQHLAASKGYEDIVKFLLQRGVDVNCTGASYYFKHDLD